RGSPSAAESAPAPEAKKEDVAPPPKEEPKPAATTAAPEAPKSAPAETKKEEKKPAPAPTPAPPTAAASRPPSGSRNETRVRSTTFPSHTKHWDDEPFF